MKKILLFFILVFINLNVSFSQGNTCGAATPFCGNACFPNNTATTAPAGPSYGCLGSEPNPEWFFIKTTAAGTMTFNINQNASGCSSGSGIDVDFICWGPFASMTNACSSLTGSCVGDHNCAGNIEDCSYSTAAVETMTIVSPGPGNYYVILITNFANAPGYIQFNQTGGPTTDCSVTCPSVLGGNGYLLAGGGNMPASVACNSPNIGLIASNNTPFGNPITPAIIISWNNNANASNWVQWYENGTFILCAGPAANGCGIGLTTSAAMDLQYSTMSPTATNNIVFCENNTTEPNMPYTIIDAASGLTLNTGTWLDDGACQTVSFPPGTISGLSTWTISPACPGCLTSTDWGYTVFSPATAGPGVWNICYNFDPPGACATYTYCQSITVTNPYATAAWTAPAPMCSNAAAINLNTLVTNSPGGTWSGTGVSGSTFNPSGLNGTYAITYTVGTLPCGASVVHNITVNPTPTLGVVNSAPSICSGSSTSITLSGGTTYTWGPSSQVGATGAVAGSGSSIAQILTTTAAAVGTVTYTATTTSAGCTSAATSIVVTVNPLPTVIAEPNLTYCAGAAVPINTFVSSPTGGTFTWTNSNTAIGLAASGVTSTPAFTATNGTGSAITGTITITPSLAGCTGPTSTFTITINPSPTVVAEPNLTFCAGDAVPVNTFVSSPVGATFTWTNSNTAIGLAASGVTNTPAFIATNGTGSAITSTIIITPSLAGCTGPTSTYTITVNPSPTVVAEPNLTFCAGAAVPVNTFVSSPVGATFTWTNSNIAIGLAASGLTSTPAFIATNGTGSAITGTITITPSLGCTGPTSTYTITINPSPTVVAEPNLIFCAGDAVPVNNFVSSPVGGSFTWTNSNIAIGLAASGLTNTPAFIATNGTGSAISGTITITPTLGGCSGATSTYTITVNPSPTLVAEPNLTFCAGATVPVNTFVSSPAGATFTWTNSNTAIGLAASGLTSTPSFTATNGTGSPITATITISPTIGSCTGPNSSYTITINPLDNAGFNYGGFTTFCQTGANPTVTITGLAGGSFTASPATLLINSSTGAINLAGSPLGSYSVTYQTTGACPNSSLLTITITTAPNSTIAYSGPYCQGDANPFPTYPTGGSAGTFTVTPAGLIFVSSSTGQINLAASTSGTYTITNTIAAGGGCAASVSTASVTINPSPVITAESNLAFCAGAAVPINTFISTPAGASFAWTNSNTTIGLAASGVTSTPAFTATNATSSPVVATITITPTLSGCTGPAITYTITVNPTPNVIATPAATTICSGTSTSILLTGGVAGATYTWTASGVGGTGGFSGGSGPAGTTISQILTAGASSGTVTYVITPSANGCTGTSTNVVITVNPIPFGSGSPQSICSGGTTSVNLTSFTAGTTFTWTAPAYTGSVSGGSASSGSTIAQTLTNSGTTTGTATYTITPIATGCTGSTLTVVITVYPVPTVVPSALGQTICSGATTGITLSGPVAGTVFNWGAPIISPAGAITGSSAGSGTSIAQTLTNATAASATATYNVIPTANGCPGTPILITITVNPNPVITAVPAPSTICSGTTTSIPLTSNVAGTTFSWTATPTGVSGSSGGSGTNIAQLLTTSGVTAGTVTYNITATTPGGCVTTTSATITVNPVPTATATPSSLTICSGSNTGIVLTSNVAGTTYVWGPTVVSGITGASPGVGASINQILTVSGILPGTLTYTITPSVGTCPGLPINVNVTVNPIPVITATPTSQTFCTGGTTGITLSSNVSGTTISWTVSQTNATGGNPGTGVTIADLLTTTTSSPGTVTYTVTGSASGCPGNTVPVVITINPIDNASFTYGSSTYCQTGTDPTATISGTPGGTFTVSPAGIVLLNPSTGLIDLSASVPGAYTITYTTTGACPNSSSITINITNAPTASFNYATPFCSSDPNPFPTFGAGSSAGVFSSTLGLVFINTNTGEIDLVNSTPGAYTVTNSIAAAGGCSAASDTASITINQAATVSAGADNSFCEESTYTLSGAIGGSAATATWSTSGTGTFSSLTSPTAIYTPSFTDITAGSVTLTYTTDDPVGICGVVTDNMVLTITPIDSAAFTYSGVTFCASGSNPTPTVTGIAGGTFTSSPAGLTLNASTGLITLSTSTLGTYNVYYTTTGVCPNTDTVSVTITNAPSATFTYTAGATAFCQTDSDPSPVFSGGSAGVFTVSPAGLSINPATGQIDLSASSPGTYTITNLIAAAGGCASSVDSLAITINLAPIVEAGSDATICAGSTYTMTGDSIGGSTGSLTWSSSGTGTFSSTISLTSVYTPSATDIAGGSVILYIISDDPIGACGSVVDSLILTISPTPAAPTVSSTSITTCFGTVITPITATGAGGTITWYSDAALTTIVSTSNPFNPGIASGSTSYWVTETLGACQSLAAQVTITVNPLPVADTTTVIITLANCGAATGGVAGVVMTSGASPFTYQWQDSFGVIVDTMPNLTNALPGVYSLTVTDANGCSIIVGPFTITSTLGITAAFTATPATGETPLTVNFTNSSTGAVSYLWQFGLTDTSTAINPSYVIVPLGSFPICLIAFSGTGCADTACTTIDVYINSVFVIPNVFSPNGDDINDVFTVKAIGLETMDAEIYNRWGQKEYEWHTTNGGWDGRTASGVLAPEGTYYFIISAKGIDGKEYFEKGGFTLLR